VSVPPFKGALGSGVPVLTAADVADRVAFLNMLTDGYPPQ
jgi:hypothetical protein